MLLLCGATAAVLLLLLLLLLLLNPRVSVFEPPGLNDSECSGAADVINADIQIHQQSGSREEISFAEGHPLHRCSQLTARHRQQHLLDNAFGPGRLLHLHGEARYGCLEKDVGVKPHQRAAKLLVWVSCVPTAAVALPILLLLCCCCRCVLTYSLV